MTLPGMNRPKVLVVDDNASVRSLARRILEPAGYEISEAGDGFRAIALACEARPDLVIADLRMPGFTGGEMAAEMRTIWPDQKILYVTRDIEDRLNDRPLWTDEAFLEKPFSRAGLCHAVALVLYGTLNKPDALALRAVPLPSVARRSGDVVL
jgi:CheY-like chemotaxis protein